MQCNRCGGQAPEGAAFCPFCGEILNIHNAVPPVMNSPVNGFPPVYYPPRKNNTWMLVVGIIFIVILSVASSFVGRVLPYLLDDTFMSSFDELSSPENVATAYIENFFMNDSPVYDDFNYQTTIDWDSVFADIYANENNIPERDYDMGYDYAERVFDEYCEAVIPDVADMDEIRVESVTVQPYAVIHNYINIFDDYFRPHGLSAVDYISYSDIKSVHEVSLTVTFYNDAGETGEIPVIVNVAEFDGYYDVITDSLFTDSFIVYALSDSDHNGV